MRSFPCNSDCQVKLFVYNQEGRALGNIWHNQSYTEIRWIWKQSVGYPGDQLDGITWAQERRNRGEIPTGDKSD